MSDQPFAAFIAEAEGRRLSIASQIEHLDKHDTDLKKAIAHNGRTRADLRELDRQYAYAIDRFSAPETVGPQC